MDSEPDVTPLAGPGWAPPYSSHSCSFLIYYQNPVVRVPDFVVYSPFRAGQTITNQFYTDALAKLFRINTQMKNVQGFPFTGTFLVHDDDLALDNHALYVARNLENTIAGIKLSADFLRTMLVQFYTNSDFLFSTVVTKVKGGLFVVNAQLNQRSATGKPVLPFTVLRVPA
ncbi:hypothetical protein [Spirosoma validum]|uniref:Uncharacterized protein n=1 Tax=Spirosoma validum TaxID=2771355 RepID=A0A927B7P8_9BACT|nr:hypothetical protein [Spirosoma validum]MBD2757264.1 hypothetical protein [Spirosoma validum]